MLQKTIKLILWKPYNVNYILSFNTFVEHFNTILSQKVRENFLKCSPLLNH